MLRGQHEGGAGQSLEVPGAETRPPAIHVFFSSVLKFGSGEMVQMLFSARVRHEHIIKNKDLRDVGAEICQPTYVFLNLFISCRFNRSEMRSMTVSPAHGMFSTFSSAHTAPEAKAARQAM